MTLVAVAALWRPQVALLVELLYFWAFSASLQALVTPDLGQPFPDVLYFTYFVTHAGAVLAASLLVFGCRRLPRPGAVWRVYGLTACFAGLAARRDRGHRRQLHVPAPQAGRTARCST